MCIVWFRYTILNKFELNPISTERLKLRIILHEFDRKHTLTHIYI